MTTIDDLYTKLESLRVKLEAAERREKALREALGRWLDVFPKMWVSENAWEGSEPDFHQFAEGHWFDLAGDTRKALATTEEPK